MKKSGSRGSFPRVELGTVAEIVAGQHIPAAEYSCNEVGTPYLTGPADFGNRTPIITKWTATPKSFARVGDVLVTVKGNGVGKTNLGVNAAIGRQLMAIRPQACHLDQVYLYHFLSLEEQSLARLGRGATVPGIGIYSLSKFHIPLPALPEQKGIAAILDKANDLQRKREAAAEELRRLPEAIFAETFLDSANWPRVPLGEAVDLVNGRAFSSDEWGNEGLPIIRIQNLKDVHAEFNYYSGDCGQQFLVEPGDLLLSWAGQLVSFGVFVWSGPRGWLNQHIFKVVPKLEFEVAFLKQALSRVIAQVTHRFHGIEMKHLTKATLSTQTLPLPPFRLQQEYASRVDQISRTLRRMDQQSIAGGALVRSLRASAFRGEL